VVGGVWKKCEKLLKKKKGRQNFFGREFWRLVCVLKKRSPNIPASPPETNFSLRPWQNIFNGGIGALNFNEKGGAYHSNFAITGELMHYVLTAICNHGHAILNFLSRCCKLHKKQIATLINPYFWSTRLTRYLKPDINRQ
jgi:hypothetical protein